MSRKSEWEEKVTRAVNDLVKSANSQVDLIKKTWTTNYDTFVYGTRTLDKEEWQTNFTINKYSQGIRTVQGNLVNILVNNPDWMELVPFSNLNQQAVELAPVFEKILSYYLEASQFKRHAGTFFLSSLISCGNLYVGWKPRLVQNPEHLAQKAEDDRKRAQDRLSRSVANPDVEEFSQEDFQESFDAALDRLQSEATGGEAPPQIKIKPYIQVGCLDFIDINSEFAYWDPTVSYLEDSMWRAFDYEVSRSELVHMAKLGFFKKSDVKRIVDTSMPTARDTVSRMRYKNVLGGPKSKHTQTVKLRYFAGPLIIDDEVVKDNYYALIANEKVVLRDGDYPFWEPPGQRTPVVSTAIRQIPYRATGAGIGDSAVVLQRILDSNYQLLCDSFRMAISGINVVNYNNLVDKSQLDEGIYPGQTLHVRGTPKDSFARIELTSNLESQTSPMQVKLEQGIFDDIGVNELMAGGSNPYSRTSAAETNQRVQAGQQSVNIVALDLEQNFLIPVLKKCFARVLQFGLSDIASNPELSQFLTDTEQQQLAELNTQGRANIINQWYKFKINGFSAAQDKNEEAMRDNEFLQIVNQGGVISQLIDIPAFLHRYLMNRGVKDPKAILIENSDYENIQKENEVLLSGHLVVPSDTDDDQKHLEAQSPLAQSPYATPAMQQHVQMHMQRLQMMQQQQAQGGAPQGAPPQQPGGAPPSPQGQNGGPPQPSGPPQGMMQ